ncbi:pentapeptide repeat-containing protein [Phytomonospora endophytica]|uniref:WD40 repeat protein/ABC-type cobalamin/Fe3+-siderophores transport system ATPase subunit n=1 Tax=Phytomonospora endophytica TaxID=714109 RepID=A0A841FKJ8_9ACTN|nr:pentapeptide repeat-containing protein [Phytomonospora endophytica]MBB6036405.1 WD40 repeat protein/ABC-type cobalamin/Fe3+-siderophores transport system ATPase subunit [Phytomonospora endophytica]GIG65727.1 hypothetical protein Pen01_20220 [Phytomonospora endophytica]
MGAERAVARILRADGRTAGLGFLVAGGRLVTCAHVVNTALGRGRRETDRPEGTVRLRFAFAPAEDQTATVTAWGPGESWTPDVDLAILALTGAPPPDLPSLTMAAAMPESSARVQLCGPDGEDRVKHVAGTLLGATGRGLRQIDQSRSGAHQASAGFSGGPVWLAGNGDVVGVMRAARGDEGIDVDCLEPGWVRENLRPRKPAGVVDVLQIGPLRLDEDTAAQRIESLCAEVAATCAGSDLAPDAIVFCGDLTANARLAEYRRVAELVVRLTGLLGLPEGRVLTVPGPGDVNKAMCESHFMEQAAMEAEPVPPYWKKWHQYSALLSELDGEPLDRALPWRLLAIPELELVVAGLNATMARSHLPQDARTEFGPGQFAWFAGQLADARYAGWKRIAVAHDTVAESERAEFTRLFAGRLDLLLTAAPEAEDLGEVRVVAPVGDFRILRLVKEAGENITEVGDTFVLGRQAQIAPAPARVTEDPFIERVITALEFEYPDAWLRPVTHLPVPFVRVVNRYRSGDRLIPSYELLVGVEPREATVERIGEFSRLVDGFRVPGVKSVHPFVYFGRLASEEAQAFGRLHQILPQSFHEFQFKWDPRHFTAWQLAQLDADGRYPADLYIPQRFTEFGHGDVRHGPRVGLTERLLDWFGEDRSHLIVVLGNAGAGKTFFMRTLARAMSATEGAPTPVYLQLRDLERMPLLDELVARQFAKAREHRLPVDHFNYYLREGRIALLLDGLDELTVQGGWDRAVRHLTEIRQKVTGKAMIVVTARDEEFLSHREIERVLREGTGSIGRRAFKIEDFSQSQIERFLKHRLGSAEAARERMDLLSSLGPIPDVARNPRMLSFIAEIDADRLVRARDASVAGLITSAELYRQVIEQWKDREEERLRRDDELPALDREQLWSAVSRLAVNLWRSGRERLTVEELGDTAELLSHVDADAQVHQISSGSLLIRYEDDRLGFIHRSIQEWFLAEAIVNDEDVADALAAQRLSDQAARFVAEMRPDVGLRAPAGWGVEDPRVGVFQSNAGSVSIHLPPRLSTPDAPILDYTEAELTGWDASRVDVRGTSFQGARLVNADFRGKDLTRANFTDAVLHGADFSGAILHGAILRGDLSGAKLVGADLAGADVSGAKLNHAALTNAKVAPGQLARAETFGAALPGVRPVAEVRPFAPGAVAAANPPGTVQATGNEHGWIHLWSLPGLRPIRGWRALPGEVRALEWSADGSHILTGGAGPLSCWEPDGSLAWTMGDNYGDVHRLSWNSADGRIACTTGANGRLDVIDRDLEVVQDPYRLRAMEIADVAWSPDGSTLAVAPVFSEALLLGTGPRLKRHAFSEVAAPLQSLTWSQDSTSIVIQAGDHTIELDLASMTGEYGRHPSSRGFEDTRGGHEQKSIRSAAWSPDGTEIASADEHGRLLVWKPRTGVAGTVRERAASRVLLDWSPDGKRLVTVDLDGRLRSLSRDVAAPSAVLDRRESLYAVRSSPNGESIATGKDGGVELYSASTLAPIMSWRRGGRVADLCWISQNTLVVANRNEVSWLTVDGGTRWHTTFATVPTALRRRPYDARVLAATSDGMVFALNPEDGEVAAGWNAHNGPIRSLSHSPTRVLLATGGDDGTVKLWRGNHLQHEWTAHEGRVTALDYSPDGRHLLSAGDDGVLRIWEGVTGEPVTTLVPLDDGGSAAFTDKGFKLLGDLNGEFWYASGQVALDPLDLARYGDLRRLGEDEPLWD